MAPDTRGNRIVRTWPGEATGDSYYQTADGRVWHTTYNTEPRTGVSYARISRGQMVPLREPPDNG